MNRNLARLACSLFAGGAAMTLAACATPKAVQDVDVKTEAYRSELAAQLDKAKQHAEEQQRQAKAQLEELKNLLDQTKSELKTAQQRNAELETVVREIKGQDLSGLQGRLEQDRELIRQVQRGLEDQSAQVSELIGTVDKKLTGRLEEQAARFQGEAKAQEEQAARIDTRLEAVEKRAAASAAQLQEAIKAVAKKLDEADALIKKVDGEGQAAANRLLTTSNTVAQMNETVRAIGSKLSAQVDQHTASLSKLEELLKQTDMQIRALSSQVNQFQGALTKFSEVLQALNDRSTELDRRVTELAGRTEGKVGILLVQQGEQAAKLDALSKRVDVEGQSVAAHVNEVTRSVAALGQSVQALQGQVKEAAGQMRTVPELAARADHQAARLEALEKTVHATVTTVNEAVRSLNELKQVLEGSAVKGTVPGESGVTGSNPPVVAAIPVPEPGRLDGGVPAAPGTPAMTDQEAYDRAYGEFKQGNFDKALTSFRLFLIQHSDSPLSPNAHFWMGECYVKTRDYERGIEEYDQVVKRFPKSGKAATALYRKAMALLELKDKEGARTVLRRLIADYPNTEDSQRARAKLASLK